MHRKPLTMQGQTRAAVDDTLRNFSPATRRSEQALGKLSRRLQQKVGGHRICGWHSRHYTCSASPVATARALKLARSPNS